MKLAMDSYVERKKHQELIDEKLKEFGVKNIKIIKGAGMKKCSKCGKEKKLWDFPHNEFKPGRKDTCKDCEGIAAPLKAFGLDPKKQPKKRGRKPKMQVNMSEGLSSGRMIREVLSCHKDFNSGNHELVVLCEDNTFWKNSLNLRDCIGWGGWVQLEVPAIPMGAI